MKKILLAAAVLGMLLRAPAQETNAPAPAPRESVCGFITTAYRYLDAKAVTHGLAVDLFVGDAQAGHPTKLRFFVNQKPAGFPEDDLQVEHEKLMHVFALRDDLTEFVHLHPLKVGPGMWVVDHEFAKGGNYKIWSDVKFRGISHSFSHPLLSVAGNIGVAENNRSETNVVCKSGYQIHFNHAGPLVTGRTNQFQFMIQDDAGNPVATENFLGAPMHLVMVSEDLGTFLHSHPEPRAPSDPTIRFRQLFPRDGNYKLFVQFRPQGAKLPPGESILAEFYAKLEK